MKRLPHIPWTVILCFPLGVLASMAARFCLLHSNYYDDFLGKLPQFRGPCMGAGIEGTVGTLGLMAGLCAAWWLTLSFLGFKRRPWTLRLIQLNFWLVYGLLLFYIYLVFRITGLILPNMIVIDGVTPVPVVVFSHRLHFMWPAAVGILLFALLHVLSWKQAAIFEYTGVFRDTPATGDRILENLRTHGKAPEYRKSFIYSCALHFMVIIVIPWLLTMNACVNPYLIEQGDGAANMVAAAVVQPKVMKRIKKKKKFMVNPHTSAILFKLPELDDSKTLKEVQQQTEMTYVADVNTRRSMQANMGGGSGKGPPGWPEGAKKGKVRFIRLQYNGPDWDDGMDAVNRSDMNFLAEFKKYTNLAITDKAESNTISTLKHYPKGFAPPFVFMNGSGGIGIGQEDQKILRDYLYDGGMLFADASSPEWDRNFRDFMRVMFPAEPLVVIADDDPIFAIPFAFPNGAPPLWHHGGMRALGVKSKGRWMVFYHPGDIHDAWKTGHSGIEREKAKQAFEMGTNIIYYAFTHYLEQTRKYRKP